MDHGNIMVKREQPFYLWWASTMQEALIVVIEFSIEVLEDNLALFALPKQANRWARHMHELT
jgi:hypothetical protein